MRIFINSHPWSLSLDLKAYFVDPSNLKSVQIVFTQAEAINFKRSRLGGVWMLYQSKLKHFLPKEKFDIDHELYHYEYIGCLAEIDRGFYRFTAMFKKYDSPPLLEIPLPSKEKLQELGLVS